MVRWILGDPLVAIAIIQHDITAGLFAPVEILVTEAEEGAATMITYVRPSSLMAVDENKPRMDAAAKLDKKVDDLISSAAT